MAVILLVMRNGRTLVFVVAHPDDDAHGIAGTVALQAADPGFRYVLVHATDGGAEDIREEFSAGLRDPLMARGATSESSSTLRCA